MTDRFTALFCDDIRAEEGNRKSYMGVIPAGIMDLPGFPGQFKSFGIAILAETEHDALKGSILMRLGEMEIDMGFDIKIDGRKPDEIETRQAMVNLQIAPFPVPEPGLLTVDVEIVEPYQKVFRAGALLFRKTPN